MPRLVFLVVLPSKVKGPTVEPAPQGEFGPGFAFVYQAAGSIVGFVSVRASSRRSSPRSRSPFRSSARRGCR